MGNSGKHNNGSHDYQEVSLCKVKKEVWKRRWKIIDMIMQNYDLSLAADCCQTFLPRDQVGILTFVQSIWYNST